MNTLMLVALAVVLLCYCGGKYCPKVLSSNKEVVLGVLVGLALCSFAGLRLEGFWIGENYPLGSRGSVGEYNAGSPRTRFTEGVDCEPITRGIESCDRCPTNTEIATRAGSVRADCQMAATAIGPCPDEPCEEGRTCIETFGYKSCM